MWRHSVPASGTGIRFRRSEVTGRLTPGSGQLFVYRAIRGSDL